MDKIIYKNLEIEQINLDESLIMGIRWLNEGGIDLEINIDWCGQEDLKEKIDFLNVKTKLVLYFARDIHINFKYQGKYTIGNPEITEFILTEEDDGFLIDFIFSFSPIGVMQLKCYSVEFIIEEI